MVRQIQVTIPLENRDEIVEFLNNEPHVFAVYDFPGPQTVLIVFKMAEKRVSKVLQTLAKKYDVGVGTGCVDIVSLASTIPQLRSYYPEEEATKKKRKYAWTDRMTVEEIFESIDSQSHLTFDYLAMVFVAAVISSMGLITDSSVTVVASMLVSPLMGPILCVTFGCAIRNTEMIKRGLRNEIVGLAICLLVGSFVALIAQAIYAPAGIELDSAGALSYSREINSRGTSAALLPGLFVAIPSGMGVALGITGGGINALVGVAISAALLPPVVNSAMCTTSALWYSSHGNPQQTKNKQWFRRVNFTSQTVVEGRDNIEFCQGDCTEQASETYFEKGAFSFLLFLINFVVIFLCALAMFRLKQVNAGGLAVKPMGPHDGVEEANSKSETELTESIRGSTAQDLPDDGTQVD
mmetsp:Transcript_28956/g.40713  ORF Transcript_28956/g.40713 Transcript_28956/m.40713 type:complete len:409 (-) Transcript_28956:32-1258(-)